jgi:hypothetical protein
VSRSSSPQHRARVTPALKRSDPVIASGVTPALKHSDPVIASGVTPALKRSDSVIASGVTPALKRSDSVILSEAKDLMPLASGDEFFAPLRMTRHFNTLRRIIDFSGQLEQLPRLMPSAAKNNNLDGTTGRLPLFEIWS